MLNEFGEHPTKGQYDLCLKLKAFTQNINYKSLFLLKGYAGTGKTSMISAYIKTLSTYKIKSVLLAPTGRAAKVLANYSGRTASTIHRKIYTLKNVGGFMKFVLQDNLHTNTVFIVDEASMLSGTGGIHASWQGRSSLLEDLVRFVYSGENCKMIFVGDTAQLPPVGADFSPAFDERRMMQYGLYVDRIELKQVVRQSKESGILYNATKLREDLSNEHFQIRFETTGFNDLVLISGLELEDALNEAYSEFGDQHVMVISRSNKRANLFNQQIRARIRWLEDRIATGDFLMVVKNNYFWLDESAKASFIANGDIIEVMRIRGYEEVYGMDFVNVSMRMLDYPEQQDIEVKVMLNSILSNAPSLEKEDTMRFYERVMEDYSHIHDKKKKKEALQKNPYYNALQVKFAYAVTCHKSQGGQWDAVFVDQGYLTEEMVDLSYMRWLYTALTRAKKKLYLVNFNPQFFAINE